MSGVTVRWDPEQYGRFGDERARPYAELLGRIRTPAPRHVVDLGCGPGNLTAGLRERWPGARIDGIDSSPEMIEQAKAYEDELLTFRLGDIAAWRPAADVDIIVSNAALQWVPGHHDLLVDWATALPTGGSLAFQVPSNFDAPSHALMREIAEAPRWSARLGGVLRDALAVDTTQAYAELLLDAGLLVDAWETSYMQVLEGENPVLEWVRGTGLRPVLAALSPEEAAEFETEYAAALREAYPKRHFGTVFPFRRTFVIARRVRRG